MTRLLRNSAAVLLGVGTFATCFRAGRAYTQAIGFEGDWHAAAFAVALMVAFGAHAAGHYVVARRSAVVAHWPYFVPIPNLVGINGVFVKLHWPIEDARTMRRIFAAGPIAGFAVSSLLFLAALPMSSVRPITGDHFVLGDSLLTAVAQRAVFQEVPAGSDLFLHPVAMAGYFGLFFNLWHLLPLGRLDAGRVVFATFGYRTARMVSWVTAGMLIVLSVFSVAWFWIAIFGMLTMIRIGRQHSRNAVAPPVDRLTAYGLLAMLVIFAVTFIPVPVRIGP